MKHCLRGWEHVPELRFCAQWTENPGPWVKLVCWFSSPVSFPPCDPGRAKAASTLSSPRPKRTATPWTRAAACSPASRRWCITTATSACLSTAPSTWPCCTQCLASSDSASRQLRYTNQTHLWAGMDQKKKSFQKVLHDISNECHLHPPFFAICNYLTIHIALCLDIPYCLLFAADTKLLPSMWIRRKRSSDDDALWMIILEPVWDMIPTRMGHFFDKSSSVVKSEAKPPYEVKPIRSLYPSGGSAGSLHQHVNTKNPPPQNSRLVKSAHRAYHSTYQNMKKNSFFSLRLPLEHIYNLCSYTC